MKKISILVMLPLFTFAAAPRTLAQQLPLVYNVENTGADFPPPVFPSFDQLPGIKLLPDPFEWMDGSGRDVTFESWEHHRAEFKAAIEDFEIGPKPDPSDLTITASYAPADANNGTLTVVVTRNSNLPSLTLTSHVTLPSGDGPFPAVIGMALVPGGGTGSLPSRIFTDRNIATIEYLHNQVTAYGSGSHAADPYFLLYPEFTPPPNGDVGQYSAWAWGVSRLIDGLEIAVAQSTTGNQIPIDLSHLAVTGCSYAGKMALFAGAFDERIALTIAQESGGGGAPSWRVSHAIEPAGTVEDIDNTNYSWFAQPMHQFAADNVYKLPDDHHELMAMVLPRALLVTGNTNYTWLSNRSSYIDARATQKIYQTFGIEDRFGFYIDGGHAHCAVPDDEIPAIEAFVDKFMLGQMDVDTDVEVNPYPTLDYQAWTQSWGAEDPSVRASLVRTNYCSLAYSAWACVRIGMSGSASFQSARKSW